MPYKTSSASTSLERPSKHFVLGGGVGLSALAGYVNVVVLGVFAVPVSHMTGAISRLGIDLATGNSLDLSLILMIVLGFLVGAILSGAIIGGDKLEPGRRYGIALVVEGAALALATFLLVSNVRAGIPVAALACGVQNGMASSYYGLIIRTTHVTGIVTDLGVLIGQLFRGTRLEVWKLSLLAGLLCGFLIGCIAGQIMITTQGPLALGIPAGIAVLAGLGYFAWRSKKQRVHP